MYLPSCSACDDTEINLLCNEMVIVLEKGGSGWWYVQAKAGKGWAPSHYLKVPTELMDANPEVNFCIITC